MNNDGCECAVCLNDIINNNNNCSVCNNGICNTCYIQMIDRTFEPINDISYICPFCKYENLKKWLTVDIDIIVDYFTMNEYKQKIEIRKIKDIIYDKDSEIIRLKNIIKITCQPREIGIFIILFITYIFLMNVMSFVYL